MKKEVNSVPSIRELTILTFIHTHTHAHACLRKVLNKLGHILNADFNLFIFDESSFHLVVNYEYLFILIRIIHNDCEVYHCTDRQ